jgi:hypothetical protein
MIPQYVLEIVDVTKMRKQITHCADYTVGTALPFVPVGNTDTMINHIMDIAPVFRQEHSL